MKELERDEIELFDDYLEMIMTYGYITLFASAFPSVQQSRVYSYLSKLDQTFSNLKKQREDLFQEKHTILELGSLL